MPGFNGIFGVIAAVLAVIAAMFATQSSPQLPDDNDQVIVSPTPAPAPTTPAPLPSEPTADLTEIAPSPTATTTPRVPTAPVEPTTPAPPGPSATPTAPPVDEPEDAAPVAPAPGTPNPGQTVPVGGTEVFVGDYETGDLTQWDTCQSEDGNTQCGSSTPHMQIVTDDVRQGRYAAHFIQNDGEGPDFGDGNGGERSEVSTNAEGALVRASDERWYEFAMKVPEDFQNPVGIWFIVMQWHSGSGSPPMAVQINETGEVYLSDLDGGGQTIGTVKPGEWVEYVLHVKFSNGDDGYVEAWENGTQTLQQTNRSTMSSDENYLKQGIYRDPDISVTHEVWLDGLRITAP